MSNRLEYNKRYNREHNKEISERKKKYYQKNKKKLKEQGKKFYQKNKKEISKNKRIFYQKNRERLSKNRVIYNRDHPEVGLKSLKKYLKKIGMIFNKNTNEYMYALNYWSKTIKKLDNHICKLCDSKIKLNAHHIMPKNDFPKLSLNIDNGITLCNNCHGKVHGFEIYEGKH